LPRAKLEPDQCGVEEWNGSEWKQCERDARSRGVCARHYNRLRNHDVVFDPLGGYDGTLPYGVRLVWENPILEEWKENDLAWCHYVGEGGLCTMRSPRHINNGYCQYHQGAIIEYNTVGNPPTPKVNSTCTVCGRAHYAKGLCRTHYNRQLHAKSDHPELELYIMAVPPPDDGYSDLEGCGIAEPFRKRVRVSK